METTKQSVDTFTIERIYSAPLEMVWKAITNKDEMKQWYFEDLGKFKPVVGNEFEFTAGGDTKRYSHVCKVTEVVENRKISYTWRYKDYQGNSIVTFELFPEDDKTRLKLTHNGLDTFPSNNPDFAKESFAKGWGSFIGERLKNYVEG